MKKLLSIVFAAFMMFAAADSALAWDDTELTAVLYVDGTDSEIGVDLGNINTIIGTSTTTELAAAGTWSLDMFTNDWSYSDLNIGLIAADKSIYTTYFGTTQATQPEIYSGQAYAAIDRVSTVTNKYDGTADNSNLYGDINTYGAIMNLGTNAPGNYSGLNADIEDGEASFTDGIDYVDMYVYAVYADGSVVGGDDTDYVSVIRFNTDGSIMLNPGTSAVPVPGAFILLGTGLAALAGLRRRS